MARLLTILALALITSLAAQEAAAQSALTRAKIDAATGAYNAVNSEYAAGKASIEEVYQWSLRKLNSELAAGQSSGSTLQAHKTRMKALSDLVRAKMLKGAASQSDLKASEFFRIEADLWATYGKK